MKRVLTALVLIPLAIGLIFFGPPLAVRAAIAMVALLCLHECFSIARTLGAEPFRPVGYVAGALIILTNIPFGEFLVAFLAVLLALTLQEGRRAKAFAAVAATLFAVVYTCGAFAVGRRLYDLSPHWLFVVLLVNWAGDSAALYVGRSIGRHKLAPGISPGKTWEGAIASTLFGAAAGAGYLNWAFDGGQSVLLSIAFALVINISGQLGDLAESVLKRGANLKDSGSLLPGHGGMLDRMDGALFSFPAAFLVLFIWRALA